MVLNRKVTVLVALIAAVGLAVSACGSSSKGSAKAAANTTPTSAVAKPTGTPVGISSLVPETGAGNLKGMADGLQAFVDYANADDGGFGGHPGALHRCDTKNDAQVATECARTAAADPSIVAAMGNGRNGDVLSSTVAAASDPLAYVCPGVSNPLEGTAKTGFCLYAGSPAGFYAALQHMKEKGLVKGYYTTTDSQAGHATGNLLSQFAQGLGMTLQQGYYPATQSDFLPVAQAAMGAKPDFVLFAGGVPQELSLAQAFVTLGSSIPMGSWSALLPTDSQNQLKDAKYTIVVDAAVPDAATSSDPEIQRYRQWMGQDGHSDEFGDSSLQGWLVGRTMQAVTKQLATGGGQISRSGVLNALKTGTVSVPLLGDLSLSKAPKSTPGFVTVAGSTVHIATIDGGRKTITDKTSTLP
ncbi:MAG: branched-chain amino acid transport system substrate-binding protein [Acidimicrobiaceae bacterium]|nr:branched-chain amino acid transport system substrate-binding protein [Acidimicrobiaceae bacterium]